MKIRAYLGVLVATVFFAASPSVVRADSFNVNVDTSSLIGNASGPFEVGFLLIDASGTGDANNTVTLSSFAFGGGSAGSVDPSGTVGGASGTLSSTITLMDSAFFNGLSSHFTPGSSLSFLVSMTTKTDATIDPSTGLTGDQFDFFVFDSSNQPITTSDPTGGNTLTLATIGPSGLSVQNFTIGKPQENVPEPSTLLLLAFGLVLIFGLKRNLSMKPLS